MNTLIRHIEYLVSRKDCVIIPKVGAILATTLPASYDPSQHIVTPPRRVLAFNSELDYNDGVLASSIQRAEELSYETAARKMKSGVDALLTLVNTQGYVRIGQLGTLERDSESQALTWSASPEYMSNADILWWEPLHMMPLIPDNVIEAPIIKRGHSRRSRMARIAASIAVLIGLGFVLSTPIHIDEATLASLAPELTQATPAEFVPQHAADESDARVLTLNLPVPGDDSAIEASSRQPRNVEPDGRYIVVVASLSTRDEALEYIAQRPDSPLRLYESGRYYRVYASAHMSLAEAFKASTDASIRYPDAWVCKK